MPHGYVDVEVLLELFGTDRTEVAPGSGVVGEDLEDDGLGHPRSITCGAASARVTTTIASTIRSTRIAAAITTTRDAAAYRVAVCNVERAQAFLGFARKLGDALVGVVDRLQQRWARFLDAAASGEHGAAGVAERCSRARARPPPRPAPRRRSCLPNCWSSARAAGVRRRARPARARLAASAPAGEHGLGGVALAPALVEFGLYGSGLRLDLAGCARRAPAGSARPAPPLRRPARAASCALRSSIWLRLKRASTRRNASSRCSCSARCRSTVARCASTCCWMPARSVSRLAVALAYCASVLASSALRSRATASSRFRGSSTARMRSSASRAGARASTRVPSRRSRARSAPTRAVSAPARFARSARRRDSTRNA